MDLIEVVRQSVGWGAIAGGLGGVIAVMVLAKRFNRQMQTTPCPKCGALLGDKKPGKRTVSQRWYGGWTCPHCQCDIDRHGKERD